METLDDYLFVIATGKDPVKRHTDDDEDCDYEYEEVEEEGEGAWVSSA